MNILASIRYILLHLSIHIGLKISILVVFYVLTLVQLNSFIVPNHSLQYYDKNNSWDYYEFVQTWVPTYCLKSDECKIKQDKFIVHGLWPTRFDGTWPSYCSDQPFSKKNISNLTNVLKNDWSDQNIIDYAFWEHEWSKHGTCSLLPEYVYFNKTIELYTKYNLSDVLLHNDITPSNHTLYSLDQIYGSFPNKMVFIDCYNKNNNSYLESIYIHLDKNLEPIYVNRKKSSCENNILYI